MVVLAGVAPRYLVLPSRGQPALHAVWCSGCRPYPAAPSCAWRGPLLSSQDSRRPSSTITILRSAPEVVRRVGVAGMQPLLGDLAVLDVEDLDGVVVEGLAFAL